MQVEHSSEHLSNSDAVDTGVTIVYDGECPFCTSFAKLTTLREQFGRVDLVDARTSPAWQERLAKQGLDINEGFAVEHKGRLHTGSDGLAFIARASRRDKFSGWMNAMLFSSPRVARLAYPVLRSGRNLTLRALGRRKI